MAEVGGCRPAQPQPVCAVPRSQRSQQLLCQWLCCAHLEADHQLAAGLCELERLQHGAQAAGISLERLQAAGGAAVSGCGGAAGNLEVGSEALDEAGLTQPSLAWCARAEAAACRAPTRGGSQKVLKQSARACNRACACLLQALTQHQVVDVRVHQARGHARRRLPRGGGGLLAQGGGSSRCAGCGSACHRLRFCLGAILLGRGGRRVHDKRGSAQAALAASGSGSLEPALRRIAGSH